MIYILSGDDTLNKGIYIKELTKDHESFFLRSDSLNKELVMSYSNNISLFSEYPVIIIENILNEKDIIFSDKDLNSLKESETIFIFKQDKLSSIDQKKYKKYGDVKIFDNKKISPIEKFNIFSITDAYANKDKITTWTLYRQGVASGIEPEAISGILFWKIKTMLLNNSKAFNKSELKSQSSTIVSIYHRAHRGELDFTIALEQFILSSLSSR